MVSNYNKCQRASILQIKITLPNKDNLTDKTTLFYLTKNCGEITLPKKRHWVKNNINMANDKKFEIIKLFI